MAEGLQTADGTKLEVPPADDQVNRDFQAAMNAPEPGGPEVAAPPARDPEAPYGRTKDGKPKKGPGGRPAKPTKAEAPRVQTAADAQDQPGRDYTQGLNEFAQGAWTLLATLPMAPAQAQATMLKVHRPNLVRGFNVAAQHNGMIRTGVEWITGSGTWIAALAMALAPFAMQSAALWTGKFEPEFMAQLALAAQRDLEELQQAEAARFAAAAGIDLAA